MRRLVAGVLAALAVAACGASEQVLLPDPDMAGTYALKTMGGFPLPHFVLQRPGFDLSVTAETMVLDASGSFTDITKYLRIEANVVDYPSDTLRGTWTAFESNVTLTAKGSTFGGSVIGRTLTLTNGNVTSVYLK
jgi:hypothetical protein